MTEQKTPLTDEEKAAKAAESQAKIAAAQKRQTDLQNYQNKVANMTSRGLQRELRRIERNGGLDTALSIAFRNVLVNTRITKEQAFENVNGKKVFRPHWVNESGRVGSFLR